MIYQAYEAQASLIELMRPMATTTAAMMRLPWPGVIPRAMRPHAARLDLFAGIWMTSTRPMFDIEPVLVGNELLPVTEEVIARTPFLTLLRFRKDTSSKQPRVLMVTPMSGHFATLARATIQTMLIDHDVYVTDWHNIRDVPPEDGVFGFEAFVDSIRQALRAIGEGTHLMAICQPTVQALAAAALMAEDDDPAFPRSLTLMAGPIDTRINTTAVNRLAAERSLDWFEQKLIDQVPGRYKGASRRVYPGFVQLIAFVSMNAQRHRTAFEDMVQALIDGQTVKYSILKKFYDEYFAVMDLSADFFLETVKKVFQDHDLPRGRLRIGERRIDLKAIRRCSLLTIEGERDDICGLGQTMAAQELCSSLRQHRKVHHVQTGVGHYGVFSGKRWVGEIYPRVRDTIAMAS